MSTTSLAVATNVRDILRDPDNGRSVFATPEIRQAINRNMNILSRELGLGTTWATGAVTLLAGTVDYTLPATDEYQQVRQIVFSSDLAPLRVVSLDEVMLRRAVNIASGRPAVCCLRPTATQTLVLMTDTSPVTSETLDILYATVPETWDAADATAPTIPFSQGGAMALELRTAASLVNAAGPERRNALAVNDASVNGWRSEAAELVRLERLAIIRLKRARGWNGGWFSAWSAA